ncbi:GntR family transcriptional regulator [Halalkalibacter oceani]|uniref:GntR family transcriptional regulator n=1 Tax=Halalkalibacter oceani TaxID=1653776 RepID=A0A9X2DVD4_9BACI|nr:GntR family transcriptional regulator [Halalkalibacter oceani]MCM3716080.1 GntR family transcriptional regulator [Halalkalibacter oceani]
MNKESAEQSFEKLISTRTRNVKSLREVVVESLREAIVRGQIKSGEHLKERDLSEKLGISTTPIKEAFRILGNEGLVVTIPRKGTYVSEYVDTNIEEVLQLRAVVEGLCAKFAAAKVNDRQVDKLKAQLALMEELFEKRDIDALVEENTRFHSLIREIANNPMVTNLLNNISSFETAFRKRALTEKDEMKDGYLEHKAILQAIIERNPERAEELMKRHINRTLTNVLKK